MQRHTKGQGIRYGGDRSLCIGRPKPRSVSIYTSRDFEISGNIANTKWPGEVWIYANFTLEREARNIRPIPSQDTGCHHGYTLW